MKPNTQKKRSRFRVRAPWIDTSLSLIAILSLLFLTLAAVGSVFVLLLNTGVLSSDLFAPPTVTPADTVQVPNVYDMLLPPERGGSTDASVIRFSGEFSVLRELLSDGENADCYFAEYETVLYSDSAEHRETVALSVSGDAFLIERRKTANGTDVLSESYRCDGTDILYTGATSNDRAVFAASPSFDMASLAGIPSVASYTRTEEVRTVSASYTEMEGQIVYYIRFYVPTPDDRRIMQEYWISPTTELVLRCRTYAAAAEDADADVVYSCTLKKKRNLTNRELEQLAQPIKTTET